MIKGVDGIIYKVTCETNGKIYIGQTTKSLYMRKQQHKYRAFKGDRRSAFQVAILDEGFDNFKWEILIAVESQDELDRWEKYYIEKYKSNNPKYGYNLNSGGVGNKGFKHSEESRRKMSEKRIGVKSPCGMLGKHHTNKTRLKISAKNKGRVLSEKTRQKISIAAKNRLPNTGCGNFKLSENKVIEIKKALINGVDGVILAKKYGVKKSTISAIKYGRIWGWLKIV